MNATEQKVLKAAAQIHDRLIRLRAETFELGLSVSVWDECQRLGRLLEKSETHGWRLAGHRLYCQWQRAVEQLRDHLYCLAERVEEAQRKKPLISAAEMYRETLALFDEFNDVRVDLQNGVLAVTTDEITLEEIPLGRFEIRLEWNTIGTSQPYEVVALDPNPAGSSSDTTHPHVQGNSLCEGNGRAAIQSALLTGRLSDFFTIVERILGTYNGGSAYVRLEEWNGRPCGDCGTTVSEDEAYYCDSCQSTSCSDCGGCCSSCQDPFCAGCLEACSNCDSYLCHQCLDTCRECGRNSCANCLDNERCSVCHDNEPDPDDCDAQPSNPAQDKAGACAAAAEAVAPAP